MQSVKCNLQKEAERGAQLRAQRLLWGARGRLCVDFVFDDEIRPASLPEKCARYAGAHFAAIKSSAALPKSKLRRQLGKSRDEKCGGL